MLIDRYITRAQANSFFIVFVSLAGLTFVVDAFNNIEEFIAHAADGGGLWRVLGRYYGYRLISFFDATSGVIALASAMFALSWLERHNELTALLAAGVTRWRIARPAILFAGFIAVVAATNRELVLPQIRDALAKRQAPVPPTDPPRRPQLEDLLCVDDTDCTVSVVDCSHCGVCPGTPGRAVSNRALTRFRTGCTAYREWLHAPPTADRPPFQPPACGPCPKPPPPPAKPPRAICRAMRCELEPG